MNQNASRLFCFKTEDVALVFFRVEEWKYIQAYSLLTKLLLNHIVSYYNVINIVPKIDRLMYES